MRAPTAGVVIGKVTNNRDSEGQGRVEVRFPWLGENSPPRWCNVASIMAGSDRGAFFMPEPDDEVLVAFEQGDWDHGYIVGFLWNPQQQPPSQNENQRMIRSKNGHTIRFVDSTEVAGNRGALIIEDGHGNVVTMTNGTVTIRSTGHLDLRAATMRIMGRPVRPVGGAI
jgi:phage baseplate assembly protein V